MRAAIIVDGRVDNIIIVDSLDVLEDVTLVEAPRASIGDQWDGAQFSAPAGPLPDLTALKAAAIAKTYVDVDAVYDAAIGRRGTEYTDAEAAARAFVDAGYEGEVSAYVSSFAVSNPTGEIQTNRWAAERIIGRADAFRGAQLAMRSTRFDSQTEMRAAESAEGLTAAVAAWDTFIAGMRAGLGL